MKKLITLEELKKHTFRFIHFIILLVLLAVILIFSIVHLLTNKDGKLSFVQLVQTEKTQPAPETEIIPDTSKIPAGREGDMIRYGRELIANTSEYLGPQGKVGHYTNNMNCQNCHLDAGTRAFGNNYLSVHSTYPKFRTRSGTIETVEKRVSDCMERSLNGKALAPDSREMLAILAYMKWLGTDVRIGERIKHSGLKEVPYLERAASPENGRKVYVEKCQLCHGKSGEGQLKVSGKGYLYPPLWGNGSYNTGAGLFRLTRFAAYVKANMPFGATINAPQLTDEEAWDVAAFVNSQPRPEMDQSKDWPDITTKPMDHPFGPYADKFSEKQHKYGPFQPIADARKKK